MTPKELYELACKYGCENEEIALYDGERAWVLMEYQVALWETENDKSICIKQV